MTVRAGPVEVSSLTPSAPEGLSTPTCPVFFVSPRTRFRSYSLAACAMAPNQKRAISVIDLDGSPSPRPSAAVPRGDGSTEGNLPVRGKEWLLAKVDELENAMRVSRTLVLYPGRLAGCG